MISGTVHSIHNDRLIVELGGVGLTILVNASTLETLTIGSQVHLFTTLVVREDSLTLYGFLNAESRTIFELVQTVSGIGPKVALSILGALTPSDLALAVAKDDIAAIEKVPGIGRKGAQRIALELKGKLVDLSVASTYSGHLPRWREDLTGALVSLGFAPKVSDNAISELVSRLNAQGLNPADVALSDLLKEALAIGKIAHG